MKQKLQSLLRNRRGISIAETVIALAIIMIVSAATISLVMTASDKEHDMVVTVEAWQCGENVVECFRWADTHRDFGEEGAKILGFELSSFDSENKVYNYTLENPAYRIEVELDYNEEGPDKLEINAVDEDGKTIYGFTYEK